MPETAQQWIADQIAKLNEDELLRVQALLDSLGYERRCPSCGEPVSLLASGAVGHSGDEHGNDCP